LRQMLSQQSDAKVHDPIRRPPDANRRS